MIFEYILNAIALGVVFLYGSTGEIITEKSGHLNLGIPGIMCVGAAGGCASLHLLIMSGVTNGIVLVTVGILCAFLCAALMGLLYSFLAVSLHANQNVTGLAMTTFGVGLMKYVIFGLTDGNSVPYLKALPAFRFPFANMGNALQYCGIMVFLGIIIAVVASVILFKTKIGLHLRAVGESPATADAAGINVNLYKYVATCIGSGIAGLGGLCYIMDYAGSREAYLSIEALGWLAIALVIFALWKPHSSIAGSIIFGALFVAGAFIPSLITPIPGWLNTVTVYVSDIFGGAMQEITSIASGELAVLQGCATAVNSVLGAFEWVINDLLLGSVISAVEFMRSMKAAPLFEMLPYVVTVIVLVVTSMRNKKENQPPASLGLSYFREER